MLARFLDDEGVVRALCAEPSLAAAPARSATSVASSPRTEIAAAASSPGGALMAEESERTEYHDQQRGRQPPVGGHPINPRSGLARRRSRRLLLRWRAGAAAPAPAAVDRLSRPHGVLPASAWPAAPRQAARRQAARPASAEARPPRRRRDGLRRRRRGRGHAELALQIGQFGLRISINRCDSASCPSKSLTRSLSAWASAFAARVAAPGACRRRRPASPGADDRSDAAAVPPHCARRSICRCTSLIASV